jgi:hypothetical protein
MAAFPLPDIIVSEFLIVLLWWRMPAPEALSRSNYIAINYFCHLKVILSLVNRVPGTAAFCGAAAAAAPAEDGLRGRRNSQS